MPRPGLERKRGGSGRPFSLAMALLLASSAALGEGTMRIASFNASLNRASAGGLVADLATGSDPQARVIAEIIQRVRPDVLLLNEFDFDADQQGARLFVERYLASPQGGAEAIHYAHRFSAPVNTGVPSGFDLDRDGRSDGPGDAWGFGAFPGQYGMLVLSQLPIEAAQLRSFRELRWRSMPGALIPPDWYAADAEAQLRLSSKSHWDLPLRWPAGHGAPPRTLHLLASHPTPPAFDGPEDRNGRRNHDEIRLWSDYLDPSRAGYIVDDQGGRGGLDPSATFVIAGDLNADPNDGGSHPEAIRRLLTHPRVHPEVALGARIPASAGAQEAAARQGGANGAHRGMARFDTADFGDRPGGPGNLRVDYVLPSSNLIVCGSGVFWPQASDPLRRLAEDDAAKGSDHRLVWVDVALDAACP